MKLSQGECVTSGKIENIYAACPVVQQIMVHGDSVQSRTWMKPVSETDPATLGEVPKDKKV
ncbi:hypothetical protein BDM02DRAFT_3123788, partial [Thelephora ganbajun]